MSETETGEPLMRREIKDELVCTNCGHRYPTPFEYTMAACPKCTPEYFDSNGNFHFTRERVEAAGKRTEQEEQ